MLTFWLNFDRVSYAARYNHLSWLLWVLLFCFIIEIMILLVYSSRHLNFPRRTSFLARSSSGSWAIDT